MLSTHTASDTTSQGRSLLPMALFFVSVFAMAGVAMEALRGTTHPVLSSFLGTAPSLVFLAGLAILGGLWYLHGESAGTFRRILALFVVGIPLAGVLGTIQGLEAAPPYWGGFAGRQLSVMLLHVLGLPTVAAAGLALLLAVATGTLAWRLAFAGNSRPASAAEALARMNAAPAAQRGQIDERGALDDVVISAGGVGLLDVEDAEVEALVVDEAEGLEVEAALPVAEEDELEEEEEALLEEEVEPRGVLHGVATDLDPDVELMEPIAGLSEDIGAEDIGDEDEVDEVEERYAQIAAADASESVAAAIAIEDEIEDVAAPEVPEAEEDAIVHATFGAGLGEEIEEESAAPPFAEEAEEAEVTEATEPDVMPHIAAMFSAETATEVGEDTLASAVAPTEAAEPRIETPQTELEEEDEEDDLEVLDGEYEDEEEEEGDEESGELWEDEEDEEGDDEDWEEDGEEQGEWEEWEEDEEEGAEEPESAGEELTVPAAEVREAAAGPEFSATILEPVEATAAAEGWIESEEMAIEEVAAAAPTVGPFGSAEEDWAAWMEERRPARGISRPRRRAEEDGGQTALFASPEDLDQDLFDRAVRLVIGEDRCSVAMLQRSLSVSFSEASALIERMQSEGVVGPQLASGRREILAPDRERAQATDM